MADRTLHGQTELRSLASGTPLTIVYNNDDDYTITLCDTHSQREIGIDAIFEYNGFLHLPGVSTEGGTATLATEEYVGSHSGTRLYKHSMNYMGNSLVVISPSSTPYSSENLPTTDLNNVQMYIINSPCIGVSQSGITTVSYFYYNTSNNTIMSAALDFASITDTITEL